MKLHERNFAYGFITIKCISINILGQNLGLSIRAFMETIFQKRNKLNKLNVICGLDSRVEDQFQILDQIGQRVEILLQNAFSLFFIMRLN